MDNKKIDEIIGAHKGRDNALVQVLLEIQSANHWLPRDVLERVSKTLGIPMSEVMHVATFYKTFRLVPPGRHEVHVCMGSSCQLRGSRSVLEAAEKELGIKPGETDSKSKFSLETGNCLGCCNLGPEVMVDGFHHGRVTPDEAKDILKKVE